MCVDTSVIELVREVTGFLFFALLIYLAFR